MNAITTMVLPAVLLVGLAVVLLGVKVLFVRGGSFPSPHVHDHQALRAKGIRCAGHSDAAGHQHIITKNNNKHLK